MRALVLAAALSFAATPAFAGKLLEAAPEAMKSYAEQAGYILSSIAVCGGDAEEETYFRSLARDNLVQLGADDEDLGFLEYNMEAAARTAKPRKRDCGEDGAVPVASDLFLYRNIIEKALKGG
ncbi:MULTISPECIES: hypothetical protein [Thalassobaculum]|uniref:Uncharacterized protein n=1 Tax=Thalassobaculum litoreum DSM 18839 TaxID=1123362 RepID=A0A8G2EXM6_9PROT|nr:MULTISPECIES: hypothetical protein [Thalassobaculum]SDG26449.1 hypothetical protein SAMN05660686_03830 [Thalassobaculum litoreum DSM 18839]